MKYKYAYYKKDDSIFLSNTEINGIKSYTYIDEPPEYNPATQRLVGRGFKQVNQYAIERTYEVVDVPQEELEERSKVKAERDLQELRNARNAKLAATDYMVLPDSPLSDDERKSIEIQRQYWRDITKHYSSLEDVVWEMPDESENVK